MAINTAVGQTDRIQIPRIVQQGEDGDQSNAQIVLTLLEKSVMKEEFIVICIRKVLRFYPLQWSIILLVLVSVVINLYSKIFLLIPISSSI